MGAANIRVTLAERGSVRTSMSGAFEVTAAGALLHSKLSIKGHGKCESALERRRLLVKLRRIVACAA